MRGGAGREVQLPVFPSTLHYLNAWNMELFPLKTRVTVAYDTTQFSVRRGGRRREGDYKQYIATIYKTRSETQNNNTECSLGKLDGWILAKLSIWLGMKTNAK